MPPARFGVRDDAAVLHTEGVVVFASAQARSAKACAELHALDGGDAEQRRGKAVFDAVEHRVAETGWQPDGGTFHDAADGILRLTRRQNKTLHPLARRVGNGRERFRRHGAEQLVGRVEREGFVVLRSHGGKVRADKYAAPRQDLLGDAAGDAQRRRQAAGKMPPPRISACPPHFTHAV